MQKQLEFTLNFTNKNTIIAKIENQHFILQALWFRYTHSGNFYVLTVLRFIQSETWSPRNERSHCPPSNSRMTAPNKQATIISKTGFWTAPRMKPPAMKPMIKRGTTVQRITLGRLPKKETLWSCKRWLIAWLFGFLLACILEFLENELVSMGPETMVHKFLNAKHEPHLKHARFYI
mgnify:CR=1 FL=1